MHDESSRLVTLSGECFELVSRGELQHATRDGKLYKFCVTDMVSKRGMRLVSLFASSTLGVVVASHRPRIGIVCINAIRRAFDSGVLKFDAPFDEQHYIELLLSESDFQAQQARTDAEIRQHIIHKAYWLAWRFPMQPEPTGILYPIPFDEPADLDYLGVTSNDVRRNIQRLASQGLLEKVLEGNAGPTDKLLTLYESGDPSGGERRRGGLEVSMRPPGLLGPKEFAQLTDGELHEEMMGSLPGSNYFEWANAELEHRDRKRHAEREESAHLSPPVSPPKEFSRKVFVVHGHDEGARESVARFLEKLGFEAIILHEQASRGRTVIEKVEANGDVGFAVVLLTPDDEGCMKGGTPKPRARQNVLLELGYFVGRLGRNRVCALKRGEVEIPSDFEGVVYVPFDDSGAWKQALGKELAAAEFEIEWNRLMRP